MEIREKKRKIGRMERRFKGKRKAFKIKRIMVNRKGK